MADETANPDAMVALALDNGRAELKLVDDGDTLILTVPDGWGFRALYPSNPDRHRRYTTIFLDREEVGYAETRGPDREVSHGDRL